MAYFDKYGVEFSDDRKTLVKCPQDFKGEYVIPDGIEIIGNDAFGQCNGISGVEMPNSVIYIESLAFSQCPNMEYVILSNNLRTIGSSAFYDCGYLCCIVLPRSITSIGLAAFAGCTGLQEIYVQVGQKERFSKMDGLKGLEAKIVERTTEERTLAKRSWEDCEQLWREKYAEYAKQETEFAKLIFPLLERNLEPSKMPPIGICLTAEEYVRFKAEGRDFKRIHAWCWSGHDIHERMRLHLNPVNIQHEYCVGVKTPRKGLYKVIEKHDAMLRCYYLGKEVRNDQNELDFLEETVEINSSPLFNYNSIGPKDYSIEVGDIIRVDDNRLVSSPRFNSKTYAITWSFGNVKAKKPSVVDDDYDDYDSHVDYSKACYDQYGGYNGFDDDTINSAFEGDPEATWNVD